MLKCQRHLTDLSYIGLRRLKLDFSANDAGLIKLPFTARSNYSTLLQTIREFHSTHVSLPAKLGRVRFDHLSNANQYFNPDIARRWVFTHKGGS
jgi:hypothetical protein